MSRHLIQLAIHEQVTGKDLGWIKETGYEWEAWKYSTNTLEIFDVFVDAIEWVATNE